MRRQAPNLIGHGLRLGLLAMSALLGGCSRDVMNPAGDIALQQRNLILFATLVMLLIIVPVMVLIVLFAWRYRRGNPNKTYDPGFDHSTTLELVIWSCPLFIIIALSAVTWTSTHLLDPFRPLARIAPGKPVPPGTKPLEVEVVGLDWKWLFIYPQQGVATVNQLVVPAGTPVHFSITSASVFNVFFVPRLGSMIYAMPGMVSQLNLQADRPAVLFGESAHFSGDGFSDMQFQVKSVPADQFAAWVQSAKGGGPALDRAAYGELSKQSQNVPPAVYSAIDPQIFQAVATQKIPPAPGPTPENADHAGREVSTGSKP